MNEDVDGGEREQEKGDKAKAAKMKSSEDWDGDTPSKQHDLGLEPR